MSSLRGALLKSPKNMAAGVKSEQQNCGFISLNLFAKEWTNDMSKVHERCYPAIQDNNIGPSSEAVLEF